MSTSSSVNLGNFHSWRAEYAQALPYYQQYLAVEPGLQDLEGASKVCHNLGYALYCLRQYKDAVRLETDPHQLHFKWFSKMDVRT